MKKTKESKKSQIDSDCIIIQKPLEDDGYSKICNKSSIRDKYLAVINILQQIFDYFNKDRILPKDVVADIRYLIDEYLESYFNRCYDYKRNYKMQILQDDLYFDED